MILRAAEGLRDSHRLRLKNKPEHKNRRKKNPAGLRECCSNQSKVGEKETVKLLKRLLELPPHT